MSTTTQVSSKSRSQYKAKAYSAASAKSSLAPTTIPRRDPGERDVQIKILFCGICHSDLHQIRNEWSAMPTVYPCVPGHEIVGRVTKVGSAVTKFKAGDVAAVGCLVDSDGNCPKCQDGLEQYCPHMTLTYNSPDVHLWRLFRQYCRQRTLCHTRSFQPKSCRNRIAVVISRDTTQMRKHRGSFDFNLDAVSAEHDINAYIQLLRRDGNITIVGAPDKPHAISAFNLLLKRRSLSGSFIGGIAETQEMLDFCGKHNIAADVEVIPIQKVNEAYERLSRADVKYRFSIDMASVKE